MNRWPYRLLCSASAQTAPGELSQRAATTFRRSRSVAEKLSIVAKHWWAHGRGAGPRGRVLRRAGDAVFRPVRVARGGVAAHSYSREGRKDFLRESTVALACATRLGREAGNRPGRPRQVLASALLSAMKIISGDSSPNGAIARLPNTSTTEKRQRASRCRTSKLKK